MKLGVKDYLLDPTVRPNTQTCRVKVWAHDNAFTIFWFSGMNMIGWFVTVLVCH
jgi:hypothetical protein